MTGEKAIIEKNIVSNLVYVSFIFWKKKWKVMWEEDGQKIAHHLGIKIERKKYVQKIVYKKTKKIVYK